MCEQFGASEGSDLNSDWFGCNIGNAEEKAEKEFVAECRTVLKS